MMFDKSNGGNSLGTMRCQWLIPLTWITVYRQQIYLRFISMLAEANRRAEEQEMQVRGRPNKRFSAIRKKSIRRHGSKLEIFDLCVFVSREWIQFVWRFCNWAEYAWVRFCLLDSIKCRLSVAFHAIRRVYLYAKRVRPYCLFAHILRRSAVCFRYFPFFHFQFLFDFCFLFSALSATERCSWDTLLACLKTELNDKNVPASKQGRTGWEANERKKEN